MFALLFWFFVFVNFGAAFYGFFIYYGNQFLATSPLLWIFVGDCPLAALLFGMAFLTRCGSLRLSFLQPFSGARKYDLSWLWFLAFVMAMKYGFWTIFVLLAYSGFYFTPGAYILYSILLGSHVFLLFETVLLTGKIKPKAWFLLPVLGYLLANDISDYLLGTHPPLPEYSLAFMFPATVFMTLAFTFLSYRILSLRAQSG